MKFILFLIFIFNSFLFSYILDEVDSLVPTKLAVYDSKVCFGDTDDTSKNKYHNIYIYDKYYKVNSSIMSENGGDFMQWNKYYEGILCSKNKYINNYWDSSSQIRSIATVGRTDNEIIVIKLRTNGMFDLPIPSCITEHENTFNGLAFQGSFANNSDCQSAYNDNGDGNGYLFENPNLNKESCAGFCYYNLPDSTDNNGSDSSDNNSNNGTGNDNSSNTNNGNSDTNNTNDDNVELSDLIPYLDEVEQKNEDIKTSLDTLNSNLNTNFSNINNSNTSLNENMNNLNDTLNNLNNSLQDLNNNANNNNGSNDDSYDGIADTLNVNPDISSELEGFKTDIENSISNSFTNYSDVFGFAGYGYPPSPISFNLLGKTYTVFNINWISQYVDTIRNIFLVVAYLFGLFLVFRGN